MWLIRLGCWKRLKSKRHCERRGGMRGGMKQSVSYWLAFYNQYVAMNFSPQGQPFNLSSFVAGHKKD